jgi:hypothetical protein
MFFNTIRILGIYCRLYNVIENEVVLYKDKANLYFGLVVGLFLDHVMAILKLYGTIL